MGALSDEELVERYRAAAGSPAGEAFIDQLFHRHHSRVAAWCYRMTGNVDSAADLAQEVFLKAFRHLDSFRGASRFTTWLYSIARNRCMDELKSRATDPEQAEEGVLEHIEDLRIEQASCSIERRQAEDLMRQLMREELDETETLVMKLHFVDELPLETVTRLLGLTNQSGAKAYVVSARRKLIRALEHRRVRERQEHGGGHAESAAN
ncbi:MAG TPA: RNA polymerase sigma factor [Candidatus Acidoferrales bacterium]|jgi:RNA polymerase sigma-70 factor (ECF subfamily)|nr:RNA polymerase sigma factor [Candidatus Acidoferrales bacterium]